MVLARVVRCRSPKSASADSVRALHAIAQVRAAGWGDACAGEAVRDRLENIEICSINVELLNRTGSFDDPAWIERRSLAARTRLEVETDPVLLPGCRKIFATRQRGQFLPVSMTFP
jgi:hypothetical protein